MAVTKIKPIKSTLKKALEYIQNPDKTDDKMLVSSFGCSYETADIEFAFTLSQALDKGNNLAHHLIQSFEPGEVSFEKAHEIGKQLADAVTKGQYEYVLTTHIDKEHVHNHIIFCAVNFVDYHKYNSNKRSYYGIRNINDRLCYENGLSVITPEKGRKGKSYIEYQTAKTGTSWKGKLKEAVDLLIPQIKDFEELLEKLQASGYEIKLGKYVSCRVPGQERFTRLKTLGIDYTEEAIRKRIAGIRSRNVKIPKQEQGISLLIDIENNIKAQQSVGYEHWAKIHNLKQAAKTMNFLTENNILQYEDLIKKIDEIILDSEQTADSLKQNEKKLSDMAVLIKNISTYQKTKDIHRGYIKAKDKEAYRRKYESSLILYEASGKALKDAGIKKLPELAALQKEYTALQKKKEAIYSDYGKLKKKVKEYQKIKQNVDTILQKEKSGKEHTKALE
ncbi:relaxase/mobilization nuclease domain-containing protein [Lachnoanaerobaculum sp. Marseille-Q4761]|uniref:relaxase/mobilization nuclease domain-containing protein n=1 Tax=Lachnoanaerobaculum sp. Marseille-Q4761 TaxID=2819511 RepID=UPI001AA1BF80|nr:relaxase/mobilization nuclease domain-containing protein [Lachnoanaerobaculum sp. Marseille-Q4761]MBO1872188.1 relaxase/mobilization nuclease domain-containing protein [Lachnoanaerobaculum sp. Marseille-Q4761]